MTNDETTITMEGIICSNVHFAAGAGCYSSSISTATSTPGLGSLSPPRSHPSCPHTPTTGGPMTERRGASDLAAAMERLTGLLAGKEHRMTMTLATDDLRATVDLHRLATHSPECWQWHRDCALLMACDEIDQLITEGNRLCDAVRGITMRFMDQRLRVALNEACDQWESR